MQSRSCLIGLMFVGMLAACAEQDITWVKEGATEASFETDKQACVDYVKSEFNSNYDYGAVGGRSMAGEAMAKQMEVDDMYRKCMEQRGYERVVVERKPR